MLTGANVDFTSIGQNFGFAAMCLIGLALGVAWAIRWLGKYVALPLVNRHIAFLDRHTSFLDGVEKRMEVQGKMHEDNVKRLSDLHDAVRHNTCKYKS